MKLTTVPVRVCNVWSQAIITNKILGEILKTELSFYADNYRFSKAYKDKRWDGRIQFGKYKAPYFSFYTGLLPNVIKVFEKNSLVPVFQDARIKPEPSIEFEFNGELRDYQVTALETLVREQRGIIDLPTSSGKTMTFVSLIAELGVPALILTHTTDLMQQTGMQIMDLLGMKEIGVIGGGRFEPHGAVTIGMFQSMNNILNENPYMFKDYTQNVGLLIVDEVHHANQKAKAFRQVVENIPAFYRYGFSATPYRTNKADSATDVATTALFGPTIFKLEKEELINKGWLTPVIVEWVNYSKLNIDLDRYYYLDTSNRPQDAYRRAWNDCILENEARLNAIHAMYQKYIDKQSLVIVNSIDLAYKLGGILDCQVVTGESPKEEREEVYRKLKSGELKHLVATNIYSEGVSFEGLEVVILGEPFKSSILTIQKIGRLMRLCEGKERGILVDFNDAGLPFFDKQADTRKRIYEQEKCPIIPVKIGDNA